MTICVYERVKVYGYQLFAADFYQVGESTLKVSASFQIIEDDCKLLTSSMQFLYNSSAVKTVFFRRK